MDRGGGQHQVEHQPAGEQEGDHDGRTLPQRQVDQERNAEQVGDPVGDEKGVEHLEGAGPAPQESGSDAVADDALIGAPQPAQVLAVEVGEGGGVLDPGPGPAAVADTTQAAPVGLQHPIGVVDDVGGRFDQHLCQVPRCGRSSWNRRCS